MNEQKTGILSELRRSLILRGDGPEARGELPPEAPAEALPERLVRYLARSGAEFYAENETDMDRVTLRVIRARAKGDIMMTLYVYPERIHLSAELPYCECDVKTETAELVNTANRNVHTGIYRWQRNTGRTFWTSYLPTPGGAWPGASALDELLDEAETRVDEMVTAQFGEV